MAKRKRSPKRPQPRHKEARQASQFDKRGRLGTPNAERRKTCQAKVPLVGSLARIVASMACVLDKRIAFRLSIIMAGMMLADDRRVAAAWFAVAGVRDDWDRFYDCLISIGRCSRSVAACLLREVVRRFDPGPDGHLTLGADDSPTKRFGKHVEGAGVHHHPTPGPADGEWLYGHNWVCLCLLALHPSWGVVALPLLSRLYVRAVDIPSLAAKYGWTFRTKHELVVDLVTWFVKHVRALGFRFSIWLVVDGAYAARNVIRPLMSQGIVVFSRLRRDAVLFDLPGPPTGKRGRPRIYGENRIHLAKRAAHRHGWQSITYRCRGKEVTRQYKTFLATSRLVSGVIRVVLVRFEDGSWATYFCTDAQIEAREILETVAARWAVEEQFHDVKEIWGAGQQQVRNVWSNIACWNLNQWMYTLVEICSWNNSNEHLADRSDRPWDNPDRRPSHADKRRVISREMLENRFFAALPNIPQFAEIQRVITDVIRLCA